MKRKTNKDFLDDLLNFQRDNWKAKVYLEKNLRGFVRLSVTTNGYQWSTIAILKDAIPEVVKLLKKHAP